MTYEHNERTLWKGTTGLTELYEVQEKNNLTINRKVNLTFIVQKVCNTIYAITTIMESVEKVKHKLK